MRAFLRDTKPSTGAFVGAFVISTREGGLGLVDAWSTGLKYIPLTKAALAGAPQQPGARDAACLFLHAASHPREDKQLLGSVVGTRLTAGDARKAIHDSPHHPQPLAIWRFCCDDSAALAVTWPMTMVSERTRTDWVFVLSLAKESDRWAVTDVRAVENVADVQAPTNQAVEKLTAEFLADHPKAASGATTAPATSSAPASGVTASRPETITRVYDVRDLLVMIVDWTMPPVWVPASAMSAPATLPTPIRAPAIGTTAPARPAPAKDPAREKMLSNVLKLIRETVEPGSWRPEGQVGSLRELNGQLVVTHTPKAHETILAIIEQLRRGRALQSLVEVRVFSAPAGQQDALRKHLAKKLPPRADGVYPLKADEAEAVAAHLAKGAQVRLLTAPRLHMFNAQTGAVSVTTYRNMLLPGQIPQPERIMSFGEGIALKVSPVVTADRKATLVTIRPRVTRLVTSDEQPVWSEATAQATAVIPDGEWALLAMTMPSVRVKAVDVQPPAAGEKEPKVTTAPAKGKAPDELLYLLVRARIVVQREYEELQFPE